MEKYRIISIINYYAMRILEKVYRIGFNKRVKVFLVVEKEE